MKRDEGVISKTTFENFLTGCDKIEELPVCRPDTAFLVRGDRQDVSRSKEMQRTRKIGRTRRTMSEAKGSQCWSCTTRNTVNGEPVILWTVSYIQTLCVSYECSISIGSIYVRVLPDIRKRRGFRMGGGIHNESPVSSHS